MFLPRFILPRLLWRFFSFSVSVTLALRSHTSSEQDLSKSEAESQPSSLFSYWFRPRYDPTMSVSSVTGEHRDYAIAKEVYVFGRAASGAPVRPRRIISRTLKYFGRILEPCVGSFSLQLFEALPKKGLAVSEALPSLSAR